MTLLKNLEHFRVMTRSVFYLFHAGLPNPSVVKIEAI
jgi:hypothetical protein